MLRKLTKRFLLNEELRVDPGASVQALYDIVSNIRIIAFDFPVTAGVSIIPFVNTPWHTWLNGRGQINGWLNTYCPRLRRERHQ